MPVTRRGWSSRAEAVGFVFTQILRTIVEVVPGGVIRYGKTAYADDEHVGFWLGVDTDGLAKFNLGGSTDYLKWTGTELLVSGRVSTGAIQWGGGKGQLNAAGLLYDYDENNYLHLYPHEDDGDTALLHLKSDANLNLYALRVTSSNGGSAVYGSSTDGNGLYGRTVNGAGVYAEGRMSGSYGLRAKTLYGVGAYVEASGTGGVALELRAWSSARVALRIIGGYVDGGGQLYTNLGDAASDTDALNRQTGDGRYLAKTAGWTGSFATGDGRTVTVVNGQITAVA